MTRRPLSERVSTHVAKARTSASRGPLMRLLGARGAATIFLGAALSIGGMSEIIGESHLLVRKDLDTVNVVRTRNDQEKVIASIPDGFAGNTVFKLSRVFPDRFVSRELALFDEAWLPELAPAENNSEPHQRRRNVFYEEMRRVNEALRRDFFAANMPYGDLIYEKAEKYDVDPALVAAVIEQESRFRHTAKSHVGARGLMQLMPRTGRWMGARDLYDPEQNVDAGVKYIKYLDKRFNGNLKKTIAAYNGGEGNVRRYNGIPPFRETQHYVKKVLKNYDKRTKQFEAFEKEQLRGGATVAETDGMVTVR